MKTQNLFRNGKEILFRRQSSIFSAALIISLTYGVSMLLGILRERLLMARFFACCKEQLDVYYAAFRLPDMIFQLIVLGALSAAFIPVFSEYLEKDKTQAHHLASSLINIFLVFFLFLSLIIFIFARPFSDLITGNFTPQQVDLMAKMSRAMLLAQAFFLISNFLAAIIQSNQRFLLPSLSPVVYNLGIIVSILLFSGPLKIWSAVLGVLIGSFLHLIIQIPLVLKLGFSYQPILNWKNPGVKKVLKLMLPRTLALATNQVEATISLFLATSLDPGSLTIYYLAQRLVDLPVRLIGTSVGQAALPTLSLQLAQQKKKEFIETYLRTLEQILYLSLPATVLFLILRVQLVRFAYGAKSFPWVATIMTGKTLAVVTLSIFSQCAIQLLVRGFYALHDTRTPFYLGLISLAINIFLSLFFIFGLRVGILGLALAFSLSSFLNMLLLLFVFNFKKEKIIAKENLLKWFKMIFASVISGFLSWAVMRFSDKFVFNTTKTFDLLILTFLSGITGILTYLGMSKILKLKELELIFKLFRKLGFWKETLVSVEEVIEPTSTTGEPGSIL